MSLFKSVILGLALSMGPAAFAKNSIYPVDTKKSELNWHGSKVVGGSHHGTIAIKEGSVTFSQSQTPIKADIKVDMASLKNLDHDSPEWNAKLVNHLKSEDFFVVTKHPYASLVIDSFHKKSEQNYQIKGKLTIKGKTKDVAFDAVHDKSNDGQKIVATLKFDRTDFDIRYGSGKFFQNLGDKMIADEVTVKATIWLDPEAVKTAQK